MQLHIKRVYETPSAEDGTRVLVDRLWPRGLTKGNARIDQWLKDIAPSTELRTWFNHDPAKWSEFERRYKRELDNNMQVVEALRDLVRSGPVTLVYSAKDEQHNNAIVLQAYINQ